MAVRDPTRTSRMKLLISVIAAPSDDLRGPPAGEGNIARFYRASPEESPRSSIAQPKLHGSAGARATRARRRSRASRPCSADGWPPRSMCRRSASGERASRELCTAPNRVFLTQRSSSRTPVGARRLADDQRGPSRMACRSSACPTAATSPTTLLASSLAAPGVRVRTNASPGKLRRTIEDQIGRAHV